MLGWAKRDGNRSELPTAWSEFRWASRMWKTLSPTWTRRSRQCRRGPAPVRDRLSCATGKILRHQLMGPLGLPDSCPVGREFHEDWFDVQHRRAVESIQALHFQREPLN